MRGITEPGVSRPRTRRVRVSVFAAALAVPALVVAPSGAPGGFARLPALSGVLQRPLTAALASELAKNVDRPVIVMMRDQLAPARLGSRAARLRAEATAAYQAPLMSELREVHATHVRSYRLVDSFAATVSPGEAAWLKADPEVAEVVPDVTITEAQPSSGPTAAGSSPSPTAWPPGHGASLTANVIPGACAPNGEVQLDPEGLALTNTDSNDPTAKTARRSASPARA